MLTATQSLFGIGETSPTTVWTRRIGMLSLVSALASGYHGVRRNDGSIGWGIAWFALGGLFPLVTPVFALAQGFGKEKS